MRTLSLSLAAALAMATPARGQTPPAEATAAEAPAAAEPPPATETPGSESSAPPAAPPSAGSTSGPLEEVVPSAPAEEVVGGAPEAEGDEVIVVTGSRFKGDKGTAKVETLSHEALAERRGTNLADVLSREAGVQTTSSFGTGRSVIIDGMDSKYVLVLVDGRPVYGRVDSALDFSRLNINPETIERIEIVRGPMSALYGSEAMGGVINIITRPAKRELEASVELGSELLTERFAQLANPLGANGALHLGTRRETLSAKLDLSGIWARRYDRGRDGKSDGPDRRQGGIAAELRGQVTKALTVFGYIDGSDVLTDMKVVAASPARDRVHDASLTGGVGSELALGEGHSAKLDLRGDRFRHRYFVVTPLAAETDTNVLQEQLRGELQYQRPLASGRPFLERLDASVGVMGAIERVGRTGRAAAGALMPEAKEAVKSGAAYAEVLYRPIAKVVLSPALRFDIASGALKLETDASGRSRMRNATLHAWNPKIGVRLEGGPYKSALRFNYGEGFRLPDFNERYLILDHRDFGYRILGNPSLKAETSRGFRLGVEATPLDDLSVDVEGYLNLMRNLITPVPIGLDPETGLPDYQYQNMARAYTSGISTSAHVRHIAERIDVDFAYQYLINAVDASDCPRSNRYFCANVSSLPLRPAHTASLRVGYRANVSTRLFSHLDYVSSRSQGDVNGDGLDEILPAYALVGLGVRYDLTEKVELSLLAENLTDSYDAVQGPKPGRSLQLNIRASY